MGLQKRSKIESLVESMLTRLFGRERYMMIIVPRGHPQAKGVLTYRQYKDMPMEQRLAAVRQDIAGLDFLLESKVPGFFSAVSGCLSTAYKAYLGDPEVFACRCYAMICAHVFVPAGRLSDQVLHRGQLDFTSSLGEIDYNIRANWLYGSARIMGRTKYLEFCFTPLLSETFKGLEYLARLYYVALDNRNPGKRFCDFLGVFSGLQGDHIRALWELRCGIAHSNSLYNYNRGQVWRFEVGADPTDSRVVVEDTGLGSLDGRHFRVMANGLRDLYFKAKAFVLKDMLNNYPKYLTNPDFPVWVRRFLSVQYLPSQDELRRLYLETGGSESDFDSLHDAHPHFGIAKTKVSWFYLFRYRLPARRQDFRSRVRDLFRP